MDEFNVLSLFNLFECNTDGKINLNVINKIQQWGLIPKEG